MLDSAKGYVAYGVSAALIAALLYWQVCATSCAFYGCAAAPSIYKSKVEKNALHCSQHEKQAPVQDKRQEQRDPCKAHIDSSAPVSTPVNAATFPNDGAYNTIADGNAIQPPCECFFSNAVTGVCFRSPPINSVLRI